MGLFAKKPAPAPTTVAEVLSAFEKMKDQLTSIVTLNFQRRNDSYKRIEDAKAYAAEVERTETENLARVETELAQADRAEAFIRKLMGEDIHPEIAAKHGI